MVDCVLIHPGAQRVIYGDLSHNLTAIEPPTWTRMIAGWLRDRGYSIAIIDQEAEDLSPDEVAEVVIDAIRHEVFYIFTHPWVKEALQLRTQNILGQRDPWTGSGYKEPDL